MPVTASPAAVAELAPSGVLKAGINLSNFLLVTGKTPSGDPVGVGPDMARAIADRLGVPISYRTYPSPGVLADKVDTGEWDICTIGAEPQRAETIAFSAAYVEIEATYLVPAGSPIRSLADIDRPGVRIAVTGRAAYGLWLERNIKQAELVKTDTIDGAYEAFANGNLEALAGLKPRLIEDQAKQPGSVILPGQFAAVQQAIGTSRKNTEGARFIAQFVEEAKASGLVAGLIAKHGVQGLSVAPAA